MTPETQTTRPSLDAGRLNRFFRRDLLLRLQHWKHRPPAERGEQFCGVKPKLNPQKYTVVFLTRQTRTWTDILDSPDMFLVQNVQSHLTPQFLDEKVIYNPTWEVHNSQQYPKWQLGKFISIHQRHEPLLCGHRHFTQSQWLHMMIVQFYNMVSPVVNHLQRWRYIIERHTQFYKLLFFWGGVGMVTSMISNFTHYWSSCHYHHLFFYLLLNHHQHRCMHI